MRLVVFGDGRAILEVDGDLTQEMASRLRDAFIRWRESDEAHAILVMAGTVELRTEVIEGALEIREVAS